MRPLLLPALLLLQAAVPVPDPRLEAAQNLIGRALILRALPTASTLHYDAQGHLLTKSPQTDWTLAGMDVLAVTQPTPQTLLLTGVRVAIRYNPDNRTFERHPQKPEPLQLTVDEPATPEALTQTLAAIFSTGIDPALQHSTPPAWQLYFNPATSWDRFPGPDANLKPILIDPKAPGYTPAHPEHPLTLDIATPAACRDQVKGTITLRAVITADGTAHRIAIRRPLGYGFDALAVDYLTHQHFTPATFDGHPVDAMLETDIQIQPICPPK